MDAATREAPAFEALVLEHQDLAYSVAYRLVGSREAAEDVTQEAFLRAYAARARFVGGNPRAWLLRIVTNVALDELRRRKRRPQRSLDAMRTAEDATPLEPLDPRPLPDALAVQGHLRDTLERALRELPDDARVLVLLSDVHDLTYLEIASITGLPVGTVKSRLSRARARLRGLLFPDGELRTAAATRPAGRRLGESSRASNGVATQPAGRVVGRLGGQITRPINGPMIG